MPFPPKGGRANYWVQYGRNPTREGMTITRSSCTDLFHNYLKNFGNVLFKSLTIQGFMVGNLDAEYSEAFYNEIPGRIARGEIKYLEHVTHGLQSAGQLLVDVLKGDNFGKAVIIVTDK